MPAVQHSTTAVNCQSPQEGTPLQAGTCDQWCLGNVLGLDTGLLTDLPLSSFGDVLASNHKSCQEVSAGLVSESIRNPLAQLRTYV